MHSHDRTLLARLGFADPDKPEPRHDLACQYIGHPATVEKVIRLLDIVYEDRPHRCGDDVWEQVGKLTRSVRRKSVAYEMPVEKGSGQYMTTVGFIDVVLRFDLLDHAREVFFRHRRSHAGPWDDWQQGRELLENRPLRVGVEAKIAPVPIGSVIRQINLYRSYTRPNPTGRDGIGHWIVATDYDMPQIDLASLKNEGITHVRLGPCFDEFAQTCQTGGCGEQVEI